MLGRRNDVATLNAQDGGAGQHAGQKGIFTQILEVSAIARFADQIHAAGQQDVEAFAPSLLADHGAAVEGQGLIPGGGQHGPGGQGRGQIIHAVRRCDTQAGVALGQGRNAQPGDAGHEPCGG